MCVGYRTNPQHLADCMEPNTHAFDPSKCEGASLKSNNRSIFGRLEHTLQSTNSHNQYMNHKLEKKIFSLVALLLL